MGKRDIGRVNHWASAQIACVIEWPGRLAINHQLELTINC